MVHGFYARLRERRGDDNELAACVERVVNQLEQIATTSDQPGMLLGKIQSGKTRAFVGAIARSFDRGFDIALVLTKGTKTLSAQTVARLSSDFAEFIEEDELIVLDIMKLPGRLTKGELSRKVVVVAKKQSQNLDRLISFMKENTALKGRKVLLIDDEADLASLRFQRSKDKSRIEQGVIAEKMDELRRMSDGLSFLQVTATPYSLYLQPEGYESDPDTNYVFKPKRPAFTEVLPIHSGYVGGNDYFEEFEPDDPRVKLLVRVEDQEQDALRRPDQRRIHPDRVLDTPNTLGIRRAIITFVLAVCVRRWQQSELGERKRKYAMIIHNDTQRAAHSWQDQVIDWIFEAIMGAADKHPGRMRALFDAAYDDLSESIAADRGRMPEREDAFSMFIEALKSDDVVREKVNSDNDVMALLDDKAELKLRTPFNIYVGGNILDRGITIPNLIAFYYGRNPKTMQADTVLQHSRMYGNRDRRDLAVTRFYTSRGVRERLQTINKFENALRGAFESGAHDRGVVFIQVDPTKRVKPCAPNKVLLSDVVAVKPNGSLLPTEFQPRSAKELAQLGKTLGALVPQSWRDSRKLVPISLSDALKIVDAIEPTLSFEGEDFEWDAMRALMEYYVSKNPERDDEVLLLVETGRGLSKQFSDNRSGLSILGTPELRSLVTNGSGTRPVLILLEQRGGKELGWDHGPFWWPILIAPAAAEPCVFAAKVAN